jgi:type IV pilus assembly protein PilA
MELMIVVAIAGILASIALPTFKMLVNRAKTAEASTNLNSMFKSASAYYLSERNARGQTGSASGYCVVGNSGVNPGGGPTKNKQKLSPNAMFATLGFSIADSVYYAYELHSVAAAGSCGHSAGENSIYTFSAYGDLDGDSIWSTFEMAAGSNSDNVLYHGFGFYVNKEME